MDGTHWFLRHNRNPDIVLDPTRVQFLEFHPNYDDGVRAGFLTREPSKAAQRMIELMVWKDPDAVRNVRMRGKLW